MTEKALELEIPVLLPGVQAEDDACLIRLETALQGHKGLQGAHLERDKRPVTLCLHYDADTLSLADVKRLAERAGVNIVNRYHHAMLPIEGMDCSDCVTVIEHSVGRLDGVLAVNVNYASEKMRVEFDAQKINERAIEKRVRELGYSIPTEGLRSQYQENRELLFSLISGVLLVIGWVGITFFGFPWLSAMGFTSRLTFLPVGIFPSTPGTL